MIINTYKSSLKKKRTYIKTEIRILIYKYLKKQQVRII